MNDKWLVIDSHAHYLPVEALAWTRKSQDFDYSALLKGELKIAFDRVQDIEGKLKVMQDAGIDMELLSYAQWSPQGLDICKAMNDGYSRIERDYPGKFICCGHIPLQGGKDVIFELERCVKDLGRKGVALVSSLPDVTLDDPRLWPVYGKIQEFDIPIVIHPTLRFPLWGGDKKYELRRTISREYDIAKACVEVMYGVLKDFPGLKFIFPHYGGGMPALKARLRAWYEPENWVIPPEIKNSPKTPQELDELGISKAFDDLFDKLYFDMAGAGAGWLPMIKIAMMGIRPERICFGTDYPFDIHNGKDIKTFIEVIKNMDAPEPEKRLMLGENIKRLFKL
jgi:predicted TIM-barrel fold metal-dependent hydrolase